MTATQTTYQAFHGDPAIKDFYLARLHAHAAADEIIQGVYWENGKGCAVGCTVHSDDHEELAEAFGIPLALVYLDERIFEGLPNATAKGWPVRFCEAIPVGADLGPVVDRIMVWLMDEMMQYAREDGKAAIQTVRTLYERRLAGESITDQEWLSAADAAARAADAAARAADAAARAAAYAAYAARAARAAACAAYAARAAARAADADFYQQLADTLIGYIQAA